jgi:hypothetical protein
MFAWFSKITFTRTPSLLLTIKNVKPQTTVENASPAQGLYAKLFELKEEILLFPDSHLSFLTAPRQTDRQRDVTCR